MIVNEYQSKRMFMGRFDYGSDLLASIQEFIKSNKICMGQIKLIGAVKKANLGYYNPEKGQYEEISMQKQLEIANGIGNISLKDGEPMAHIHLTVSDNTGRCYAGHLLSGTTVFVTEFFITELAGPSLSRQIDKETGVPLWGQE